MVLEEERLTYKTIKESTWSSVLVNDEYVNEINIPYIRFFVGGFAIAFSEFYCELCFLFVLFLWLLCFIFLFLINRRCVILIETYNFPF